jgi:uncharacterized membrane protein
MSGAGLELAVVRFHGENGAVERYAEATDEFASRPPDERPRWTRDVGFVERHHSGRLRLRGTFAGHYLDLDEGAGISQRGAGEGAAAGGLLGVLAGPPGIAVGLVLGAIVGAHVSRADEVEEEPEDLATQLREVLPPSSSAIVMIAPPPEVDELVAAVADGAEGSTRRALAEEEVTKIEASLSGAPRAAED